MAINLDYEKIVADLERVAKMLRNRPDINHGAAERLSAIADEIRRDARLRTDPHDGGEEESA